MTPRTVWTLLVALLLQLAGPSVWALHSPASSPASGHCHERVVHDTPATDADQTSHPKQTAGVQADSHHCCAVGLALGLTATVQALPQTAPQSRQQAWTSLSPRPALRPPI